MLDCLPSLVDRSACLLQTLRGRLAGLLQLAGQLGPLGIEGGHLILKRLLRLALAGLNLIDKLLALGIDIRHLRIDGLLRILRPRLQHGVARLGRALKLALEFVECLRGLLTELERTWRRRSRC
ncbi:MAG: hypothetical protein DWH82_03070 [Planctomycetota bacterium]|nr:MAG: hypothetical protein DWH82_03070 [Planctomycetota bacterium]